MCEVNKQDLKIVSVNRSLITATVEPKIAFALTHVGVIFRRATGENKLITWNQRRNRSIARTHYTILRSRKNFVLHFFESSSKFIFFRFISAGFSLWLVQDHLRTRTHRGLAHTLYPRLSRRFQNSLESSIFGEMWMTIFSLSERIFFHHAVHWNVYWLGHSSIDIITPPRPMYGWRMIAIFTWSFYASHNNHSRRPARRKLNVMNEVWILIAFDGALCNSEACLLHIFFPLLRLQHIVTCRSLDG